MTPKPEQTRWASQEAAIKAEINEAKNTVICYARPMPSYDWTRYIPKWKRSAAGRSRDRKYPKMAAEPSGFQENVAFKAKRPGSAYRAGWVDCWLKIKNSAAPAVAPAEHSASEYRKAPAISRQ